MPQRFKFLRVAEKLGHIDQQVAEQRAAFVVIGANPFDIFARILGPEHLHPAGNTSDQCRAFVTGKVMTDFFAQDFAKLVDIVDYFGCFVFQPAAIGVAVEKFAQGFDDFGRPGFDVDQAGADRGYGHTVIPCGVGLLRNAQAAMFLDRAQPAAAIGAGARQDYAGGQLLAVFGQAFEEIIDWPAHPAGVGELGQLKHVVMHGKSVARRDDVNMVHFQRFPAFGLFDRHQGVPLDQLGHQGFVRGVEVLNHDEGHAGPPGETLKHFAQRLEAARRCAYPHDGHRIFHFAHFCFPCRRINRPAWPARSTHDWRRGYHNCPA